MTVLLTIRFHLSKNVNEISDGTGPREYRLSTYTTQNFKTELVKQP